MTNRIAIIDTMSLTHNDSIYGHFTKVTLQLDKVLSINYNVTVVAGNTYKKYFDESKLEILPYIITKDNLDSENSVIRIKNKIKSLINTITVLSNKKYNIFIFHDNNQGILYFSLLFIKPSQQIILIRYTKNKAGITNFLYKLVKSKFSFIITSLETVAKAYSIDSLIIPDYLPINEFTEKLPDAEFDFVMAGTISSCKDIEDVLISVFNSNLTIKVAGHFENNDLFMELNLKYGNCSRITIVNKYLTEVEYANLLKLGRYVLLPYKADSYLNRSSGVMLDAIYTGRPVIGSSIEAFKVIKDFNLGFIYKSSLSEVFRGIELCDYQSLLNKVYIYRTTLKNSMSILLNKIEKLKIK